MGPAQEENIIGGTSWIELFILFDTTAARSAEGEHIKEPEAAARAEKRKKKEGRKAKQQRMETARCLPTLDEELKSFKAIVRHIMRHEVENEQSKWFKAEGRNRLRRLAKLGIIGHQLAIVAYCKVSMEERDTIIECLLKQKVGSNPKNMKIYVE